MKARFSHYLLLIGLVLAWGGVAGCSRSDRSEKADANVADHAVATDQAQSKDSGGPIRYPASDYIEQQKGVPGGTLRVSVALDTGSLDLHTISHTNAEWLGRIIYDNLVYLDDSGNITPWLAKSWTISPDGLTYTFQLREDVTFSDGTKFNAEAVRVNLDHMRDPATKSPLAAAYIAPYQEGRVLGEYTFQAVLREPYHPFLEVLAQSWLSMESPTALKQNPKQLSDHPVGTGPYVVESYTRQQGIKFVKRPDYHWAPDFVHHEGPAYLDRIELEFVPEAMVRYTSLAAAQYDLTIDAPAQNAAAIRADSSLVFNSRIRKGIPSRGITFNTSLPPFNDLQIRQAFALAVDREGITQLMGFGEYRPKADLLAANTQYYDPSFQHLLHYDPSEANQILDAAGWTERNAAGFRTKNGQELGAEVLVTESLSPGPLMAAIQSDVKKIGFNLKITQLPATQILSRRNANQYQALSGGYWHTNTPDAIFINYHSQEITTEQRIGQNNSRLQDPALDDLLLRARRSSDPTELQTLYSQAQKRVLELVPAVPIYDNYTLTAWNAKVKGVIFDTSHNTIYFPALWLDTKGSS